MSRVLYTFLGSGSYYPARYRFGDRGTDVYAGRFFPHPLLAHLTAQNRKVHRIVLCGTRTSNWRRLAEVLDNPETQPSGPPIKPEPIRDDELPSIESEIGARLESPVHASVIPFGTTRQQQIKFIEIIANAVSGGDDVNFDVTHGLRHLPLLTLFAALAVGTVRNAQIEEIWYGAYDLRDEHNVAPVMSLRGLFDILKWTEAVTIFDQTGDVSNFGSLIDQEIDLGIGMQLRRAAFRERVAGPGAARQSILAALDSLSDVDGGISSLFRPAIEARFAWARKPEQAADGLRIAKDALKKGNEVRAVTLGFEAVLAMAAAAARIPADTRDFSKYFGHACAEFQDDPMVGPFACDFLDLRSIRNAIVHVEKPKGRNKDQLRKLCRALDDPEALREMLLVLLKRLERPIPAALVTDTRRRISDAASK
jgi:CRISPR-associated Csx2 family protein